MSFLGGVITVYGGTATTSSSPVDIGGGATDTGKGGDCNTVIILTSVNSGEGLTIGGGKGLSSNDGSDGAGIKPAGDGTYTVYGDLELPCDITIPQEATVVIPDGASLTVPEDVTLTNNGTIQKQNGGSFINDGTVTGQQPADDRYSIDYEEETITIAEGYSLYNQQSDGEAIFSSTSENSTTSLTNYIQSTDQKLYLQAPTTGEGGSSDRREITIPARPQAPNTYSVSIDYSEEKLDFPPGLTATTLEYATELTNPEWKDVPSGAALAEMGWNGSVKKTYYFRSGATNSSFASSSTTQYVEVNSRPNAPATPTLIEVTSNSITIQVTSGQEYRLGPSGEWKTLQGTTGSDGKTVHTFENLTPGTSYTIETRTPADNNVKSQFASHPASVTVTTKYETELGNLTVSGQSGFEGHFQYGDTITVTFIPERQTNTSTNALAENTATLTYTNAGGETVTLATAAARADGSFELTYDTKEKELPIGENLTLTVSYGGSGALNPAESKLNVTLEKAPLKNAPTVTGEFVFDETLTANYTKQDDETVTYQWYRGAQPIDGATSDTYMLTAEDVGQSIKVTVTATDDYHTGSVTSTPVTVGKAQGGIEIACDSVTYGEKVRPSVTSTTNTGADVTYSYEGTGGTGYGPSAAAPTTPGTYAVTATVAETATHTSAVSDPAPFSIARPYVPPVTPSGVDWGEVADDIASAEAGGRVVVDMDGETELPGEVLEALAGRDVTLALEMGESVAWEIWGGDVPEGTSFSDVDMGVELGTDGIPVSVVNLVTGETGSIQVTLAHEGPFGFALTLVAPVGEKNAGLVANMYCYDEAADVLRYEAAGVVDEDGLARVQIDHASSWLIALDDRLHALPFLDADEGEWYSEAVRWAWLSGTMTGYADGSGLFGTGDVPTRAQAAAVLYNAAGNPAKAANLSPFPDAGEVSSWALGAVEWAVSEGVINGHDGLLEPARACSRAEAAALMMNLAARG